MAANKKNDAIRRFLKNELGYAKGGNVFISGPESFIMGVASYFIKIKKFHITILAQKKSNLVSLLDKLGDGKGIRYVLATQDNTGIGEGELDYVICYIDLSRIGGKGLNSIVNELYNIAKTDAIVMIFDGRAIDGLGRKLSNTNFSSSALVEHYGLKCLKLTKIDQLSLLPQ